MLFVAPAMPAEGGNGLAMRIGLFLEAYASFAEVHSLVLPISGSAVDDRFCRRHSRRSEVVPVAGRGETPFALLAAMPDPIERCAAFHRYGRPSLTSFLSAAVRADIRSRLATYDLVHLSRAYLAPLAEVVAGASPGVRIVIDLDEDEPSTRRSLARLYRANGNRSAADWEQLEASAYERLLASVLPAADVVTLSSDTEARRTAARASPGLCIRAIPNAVAVTPAPVRATARRSLIFVGSFGYFPNQDAALWTVRAIWPRIEARCRDVRLSFVGQNAGRALRRLARGPRVTLQSDVSEIAAAYGQSSVAIVPIRAGGGTRIKLLEAGAYGLPCVSTRIGAEGLAVGPLALADTAEDFAGACVELLQSPALRHMRGQALRRSVRHHHDRRVVLGRIVRLVSALC